VVAAADAAVAPVRGHATRAIDLLLGGLTTRMGRGYTEALPGVERALEVFQQEGVGQESMLWCWLACQLAMDLWDDGACENIATRLSVAARERGALNLLPFALNYSAAHQLFAGRFDVAEQLI